jgi:pimeloyl-ACP methyl ester carboxylesterase
MNPASDAPEARYYQSQGLRLHYTDWGNDTAPPLLLIHGGLDHSRSWDAVARALRTTFHVVAPDLRGHGDSDWATGSSYSLADHVYDLTSLVKSAEFEQVAIVSHSMGGMVSLTYAGAFPQKVSRLAVLDGVTNFPARRVKPIEVRFADWVAGLDKTAQRKIHRYPGVADGADRILARNARLTREQAMHLASHALKRMPTVNTAGSSTPICAPARRTGCRWKITSRCGRASPVRPCWSPAARVFCRIPQPPACSGISGRPS